MKLLHPVVILCFVQFSQVCICTTAGFIVLFQISWLTPQSCHISCHWLEALQVTPKDSYMLLKHFLLHQEFKWLECGDWRETKIHLNQGGRDRTACVALLFRHGFFFFFCRLLPSVPTVWLLHLPAVSSEMPHTHTVLCTACTHMLLQASKSTHTNWSAQKKWELKSRVESVLLPQQIFYFCTSAGVQAS